MSEDRHLTQESYEAILQALDSKIYGTFEAKHLVYVTGYSKNVISEAIKRLKKEGKIIPHTKTKEGIVYIKTNNRSAIQHSRFHELTQRAKEIAGDLEFTMATIAKALNISPQEADSWFREAVQRGVLVKSKGPWAKFKQEEEVLT